MVVVEKLGLRREVAAVELKRAVELRIVGSKVVVFIVIVFEKEWKEVSRAAVVCRMVSVSS